MNNKSKLVIVVIAIVCYLVITFIYNNYIVEKNYVEICVLKRDITKGESLTLDDMYKLKINTSDIANFKEGIYPISEYVIDLKDINNIALKDDYSRGTVVLNNMLGRKENIINPSVGKEVIAIPLNKADLAVSYQIEKGSNVNLYYSAKSKDVEDMDNKLSKYERIENSSEKGYVTVKLFSNIKVIDVYNKYGESVDDNITDSTNLMETFIIEVSNDEAILMNYLKNYGSFSVTLVK